MIQRLMHVFLVAVFLALPQACSTSSGQVDLDQFPRDEKIRVACVGDSITYGYGIENRRKNSYPSVLQRLLGKRFKVKNFGVNATTLLKDGNLPYWTIHETKDKPGLPGVEQFRPHIVVLMLGTNDTKPKNWKHRDDFENDLRAMIGRFKQMPSHPAIRVCLPVPVYEDHPKWGINEENNLEIQAIIRRVVEEKNDIHLIDLHSPLKGNGSYFLDDGVHPSAEGAKKMAQVVRNHLVGKPKKKR